MKKITYLFATLLAAIQLQAQIVYLYHADLVGQTVSSFTGEVNIYESLGNYVFDISWHDPGFLQPVDEVLVNSSRGYYGTVLDSNPDTFWFPMNVWESPYAQLIGQDVNLNFGGDMANGAVGLITAVVPELGTFGIFTSLMLLCLAGFRRRRGLALVACAACLLCSPAFAADDDPIEPLTDLTLREVTTFLPCDWTITIKSTPVTKLDGTNVANITLVTLTRCVTKETRLMSNGDQMDETKYTVTTETRDITEYVRTNLLTANGFWRLDFNTNMFTDPAKIWRKTIPVEPEPEI